MFSVISEASRNDAWPPQSLRATEAGKVLRSRPFEYRAAAVRSIPSRGNPASLRDDPMPLLHERLNVLVARHAPARRPIS